MKHYLQVSGLSRSITTLSYKWFPNHRENHYAGTLKDKWERCHMQGQSQTSQTTWLSLLPQEKMICGSRWAHLSEQYHSHFLSVNLSSLLYIPIYIYVCKLKFTHTLKTMIFIVLEKTNKQQLLILVIAWMWSIPFQAIEQDHGRLRTRGIEKQNKTKS